MVNVNRGDVIRFRYKNKKLYLGRVVRIRNVPRAEHSIDADGKQSVTFSPRYLLTVDLSNGMTQNFFAHHLTDINKRGILARIGYWLEGISFGKGMQEKEPG